MSYYSLSRSPALLIDSFPKTRLICNLVFRLQLNHLVPYFFLEINSEVVVSPLCNITRGGIQKVNYRFISNVVRSLAQRLSLIFEVLIKTTERPFTNVGVPLHIKATT